MYLIFQRVNGVRGFPPSFNYRLLPKDDNLLKTTVRPTRKTYQQLMDGRKGQQPQVRTRSVAKGGTKNELKSPVSVPEPVVKPKAKIPKIDPDSGFKQFKARKIDEMVNSEFFAEYFKLPEVDHDLPLAAHLAGFKEFKEKKESEAEEEENNDLYDVALYAQYMTELKTKKPE